MAQERNEPERVHGLRGYKEESEEIKADKRVRSTEYQRGVADRALQRSESFSLNH